MDNYEQQPEERVITNKQCDAWIKRIEKRWGPIRDKDGNELTTEEKRAMGRRDLAANPRRGPRPGSGKSKNKPGKDNLPVKTIPEAVAVPSDDSCIPLLVRAGYQDIVKSNTVFSAKQLTDIFYQNPCANTLKQLGKRLQTAEIVEYYRLPGSTNPNTGTVVKAEVLSPERRSIHEFDAIPSPAASMQALAAARHTHAKNQNIVEWSEHMLKQVEALRQCRGAIVGDELRNNFCFVYLCLLKNLPITDEEIKRRLWKFNQGFVCPMSKTELRSSLTTPWKKHYRLSTARIIVLLEINDTEAATIGLKTGQSLPDLGAARRQRNEEIIRLAQQGAKVKDIAAQLSVSENTVRKVIKTNKIPSRKELIVRLHQQGLSNAEIAQRAKCTVRNVQLALKNEKKRNFPHNDGGNYLGSKDAMAPIGKAPAPAQKLSPALELLRKELYSRYGQNLAEAEFMSHFFIALQKLYEAPTEEQIKAWFSAPLSPGQDKMYRILLELN